MVKVLAALALLSVAISNPGERLNITMSPKPPSVGEEITITAGANMKLRIELDPNGVYTVQTGADGKATFEIPAGAASIIISDPTNQWSPDSSTVNP
jgi:hypothetical protein